LRHRAGNDIATRNACDICGEDAMRRVVPALVLLLTAGCAGGGAPPPETVAQLHVGFGGLTDTIDISAVDRLALHTAALVAPDGTETASSEINVVGSPRLSGGQSIVGDPWQNALSANGSAARLVTQQAVAGAALRSEEQLMATVSTAQITLPDPVAYRRDWQHYKIRLTFGTPPGEVETRELAAPALPPQN
jgi:hypothetical protein